MKVRMDLRGVELTTEMREYIRRRLHFSLGRFAGSVRSLSVRLADVNGPRGGVDKCCRIRVDVGLRNEVIVSECQATVHAAVAFAAERAERAVRRQLKLADAAGTRDQTARPALLEV